MRASSPEEEVAAWKDGDNARRYDNSKCGVINSVRRTIVWYSCSVGCGLRAGSGTALPCAVVVLTLVLLCCILCAACLCCVLFAGVVCFVLMVRALLFAVCCVCGFFA